jgi:hypothetical protein
VTFDTSAQKRAAAQMNLLPQSIDNTYRGRKLALWIFGLVVAVRALQSIMIFFNGYNTARTADGIPLETYPAAAAQTILALFALSSLWRLIVSLICVIVLVRYRRAIPFMFVVLALTFLAAQVLTRFIPIVRVGSPPGVIVNLILFGLTVVGLVLSLWKRPRTQ